MVLEFLLQELNLLSINHQIVLLLVGIRLCHIFELHLEEGNLLHFLLQLVNRLLLLCSRLLNVAIHLR